MGEYDEMIDEMLWRIEFRLEREREQRLNDLRRKIWSEVEQRISEVVYDYVFKAVKENCGEPDVWRKSEVISSATASAARIAANMSADEKATLLGMNDLFWKLMDEE